MILTGKEDLRIQKTVEAIRAAFESMLAETDYEKITVTELCARARINKKTFYHYHADLNALLEEMQQQTSEAFIERVKGLRFPEDADRTVREFFTFSAGQSPTYEKITCGGNYSYIRSQMIKNVMTSTWQSPKNPASTDKKQEIMMAFMQAASLEIYRFWVQGGKKIPLNEITEIAVTLICKGINGMN